VISVAQKRGPASPDMGGTTVAIPGFAALRPFRRRSVYSPQPTHPLSPSVGMPSVSPALPHIASNLLPQTVPLVLFLAQSMSWFAQASATWWMCSFTVATRTNEASLLAALCPLRKSPSKSPASAVGSYSVCLPIARRHGIYMDLQKRMLVV